MTEAGKEKKNDGCTENGMQYLVGQDNYHSKKKKRAWEWDHTQLINWCPILRFHDLYIFYIKKVNKS